MSKNRLAGPAIAILISIVFVVWMLSGTPKEDDTVITKDAAVKSLIPTVQVVTSVSREVQQSLTLNGITEAARFVSIRSEANGKVIQVLKSQGDKVKAGEIILRLDPQDIPARIKQAQATREQARLEYEGAQKLIKQGLQNEAHLAAGLASYEQSKAQLESLELQLSNTTIKAPFSGQIENSSLELGSYVQQGDEIAQVYDYSQLKFIGSVSEKDLALLTLNQTGTVKLISGEVAAGKVTYIGTVTNPATRTFTVELTVPKVDRAISGVTSVAKVSIGAAHGHYISPALLFVNDDGEMGLKTLDNENRVVFNEITIIHSDTHGVWITGLPDQANIIIVGQGFVNVGDETKPTSVDFDNTVAVGL